MKQIALSRECIYCTYVSQFSDKHSPQIDFGNEFHGNCKRVCIICKHYIEVCRNFQHNYVVEY